MVKGLTALSMLSHENVVAYVDSWESDNYIYLMTEFCENGNFYDYVLRHTIDASSIKYARWLLDISRALQVSNSNESSFEISQTTRQTDRQTDRQVSDISNSQKRDNI